MRSFTFGTMDQGKNTQWTWWWLLPAVFAVIHAVHGALRHADPDEFQTLTNAFDASRGLLPYVDFWDNHGPLNIWLLQPLLTVWIFGHEVIYLLRAAMWANTLLIVLALLWFVRWLYPKSHAAPPIAAMFLLAAPPFLAKSIEIRGDNPANLLGIMALICLAGGLRRSNGSYFLLAGLLVGTIAGFTLKAVIVAAALALFVGCWHVSERRLPRANDLLLACAGAIVPVILMGVVLQLTGTLGGFVDCYFGGNVNREFAGFTSSELTGVFKNSPVWTMWMLVVVVIFAWRIFRGRATAVETGLWAMTLFYLAQFLLFLPTKNMQSLLPAYFPLAVLSARATADAVARRPAFLHRRGAVVAAGIIASVLLIRDIDSYCNLRSHGLARQVAFADKVLFLTEYQPMIFDPSGAVFLKPKPGPFHVLVTFIREMHQSGAIDLKIPTLLKSNAIKALVFDDRSKDLRHSDVQYMVDNYKPTLKGRDRYLLASTIGGGFENKSSETAGMQDWADDAYEDAEVPGKPINPPEWYVSFMQRYNSRQAATE